MTPDEIQCEMVWNELHRDLAQSEDQLLVDYEEE